MNDEVDDITSEETNEILKEKNSKKNFYEKVAEDLVDMDPNDLQQFIDKYKTSVNFHTKEYKVEKSLEEIQDDFN